MKKNKATRSLLIAAILVIFSTMLVTSVAVAQGGNPNDIAEVSIQSSSITWVPMIDSIKGMTLTITGPGGFYFQEEYTGSARPTISRGDFGDGTYAYEIVLWPDISQDPGADQSLRGLNSLPENTMTQSGAFTVLGGSFVTAVEEASEAGVNNAVKKEGGIGVNATVLTNSDGVIRNSLCVGFDCLDAESFGFDTIRLKENNLQIHFEDTSVGAFPTNDWRIIANSSDSGGASFLAFEDSTGAKTPFKVTAGAPTNSLFVSSTGNLGIGTGTPVLDIHAANGDTPALRLEQNGTGGFTPQTWDIAGNEANFFIRDVTGGSRLPFRIRPGAPTSSIDINASGNVGMGTTSPAYNLEIEQTGVNASIGVRRTDGAIIKLIGAATRGVVGTQNNFPLQFWVNNTTKMTLATDGSLTVIGPVNATAFNVSSDVNSKENFAPVNQESVLERLSAIPISTWNFIENDNKVAHMGPMAQDFYAAFGLGMDNKHISTVDADGVAFAAIQELNKRNEALSSENASLRGQVDNLAARISALESNSTTPSGQSSQNGMIFLSVLLVSMNLGLIAVLVWSIRRGSYLGIKPGAL
jgi:hypothetical protein